MHAQLSDLFRPGQRLDEYEIEDVISRGYFSYNLRVRKPDGVREHAVVPWRDEVPPEVTYQGLLFEMALKHPGLAEIKDVRMPIAATAGHAWFVRELLPAPLADGVFQTRKVLPARQVLEVGRDVCDLLEYLHDRARRPKGPRSDKVLVHGFLVPGYIHRDEGGAVKVAGMDVQVLVGSGVPVPLRHLAYRAPESLGSPPDQLTPANDLWALAGCMLYLAGGEPPTSSHNVIANSVRQDVGPGPGPRGAEPAVAVVRRLRGHHQAGVPRRRVADCVTDPGLRAVLRKAFAPKPAGRFETAAEMRHAIEQALRKHGSYNPGDRLGSYRVDAVRRYGVYSDTLDLTGADGRRYHGVVHTARYARGDRAVVLEHLRFLQSLKHPRLATIFDIGEPTQESHDRVWYAREWLETSPEDDAIAGRSQPPDAVLRIGRDLCDVLKYLHGRQHPRTGRPAVHGFLLPGYVYLAGDGGVKLTGTDVMGLALAGQAMRDFHGPYRAPECASASPSELTAENDLWAVAAVMYRFANAGVITGGASPIEVGYAHRHGIPRQRANLLPAGGLRDVLARAFVADPRFRYETAGKMRKAIDRALVTLPSENLDSAALGHAIETTFPHPVARAFHQLRAAGGGMGEFHQLVHVLEATFEHLGILALATYFAGSAGKPHPGVNLAQVLEKPLSLGTWVGVLRVILKSLEGTPHDPFVAELSERFFTRAGEAGTAIEKQVNALLPSRNLRIHGSHGKVPTPAEHQEFKQSVFTLLRTVAFLKDYPLVSVQKTRTVNRIKTHTCLWHLGFDETFQTVPVQCDLDLECGRVAVLLLRTGEVLDLHPFYAVRLCPEPHCGAVHVFRFVRRDRNRVHYVSNAGHALVDPAAGDDLDELVRGSARPPSRRRAAYLSLGASDSGPTLPPGHRIGGRYEILDHLRRGGMADVYRAREVGPPGRLVALKLLPFRFIGNREIMERFRLEALRRIRHTNITEILDQGEDPGHHYLVMELATGWSVDGRAALDVGDLPKPRPLDEAVAIVRQACEGLHYIHSQETIHRDIKPSNLLLFENRVVKLADFGIARWREAATLTQTGLALGTPEYMAPEQVEGKREPTPATDIYSLGVVLYELLTGKSPFKRRTPLASAYAHVHEPVPNVRRVRKDVPAAVASVVRKCLAKTPEDRYQTAWELYEVLVELEGKTPSGTPGAS